MSWLLFLACATAPKGPFSPDGALRPALDRLDTDKDGAVRAEEWARVEFHGPTFAETDADHDGTVSLAELRTITFAQDPASWYEPGEQRGLESLLAGTGVDVTELARQLSPANRGGGAGNAAPPGPGAPAQQDAPGPQGAPGPGPGVPGQQDAPGPGQGAPGPGQGGSGGQPEGPVSNAATKARQLRPPVALNVLRILVEEIAAADPSVPLPDAGRIEAVGRAGSLATPEARALLAELEAASIQAKVAFPAALASQNAPPPPGKLPAD